MVSLRTSLCVLLAAVVCTVTCNNDYWVKCTAGLYYVPRSNNFRCSVWDRGTPGPISNYMCPMNVNPAAIGNDCKTVPRRGQKARSISSVTCRDTYALWPTSTSSGILCNTAAGERVQCNRMVQAASIRHCTSA